MRKKIIGLFICMLMIAATGIPVAMVRENSNTKPVVANASQVIGINERSSLNSEGCGCDCNDNTTIAWQQLPDLQATGIDIRIDWNGHKNPDHIIADDFKCNSTGPLTDIHFWGSWKNDTEGVISKIHLSIYKDIPMVPGINNYSMPGAQLWYKDFGPNDFTVSEYLNANHYEWWWDPSFFYPSQAVLIANNHLIIPKYDITISPDKAFNQTGTPTDPVTYWLGIYVIASGGQFGWKTSYQHWQDAAVGNLPPDSWAELRYPLTHQSYNSKIDMAFQITKNNSTCCFRYIPSFLTWPPLFLQKWRFFYVPISNICPKVTFPGNTVPIQWTFKNTYSPSNSPDHNLNVGGYLVPPGGSYSPPLSYYNAPWPYPFSRHIWSPFLGGFLIPFDFTLKVGNCFTMKGHGQVKAFSIFWTWDSYSPH